MTKKKRKKVRGRFQRVSKFPWKKEEEEIYLIFSFFLIKSIYANYMSQIAGFGLLPLH